MLRFGSVGFAILIGCSASTTAPPVPMADASVETSTTDAAKDDSGSKLCKSQTDCTTPGARACDTTTGKCVQCTKANDTCAPNEHCDEATDTCVAGCKSDEGCATSGDAGVSKKCDVASHTCVDCLADGDCPSGYLCAGKVCSAGCSGTKACPSGQTCCAGACVDTKANVDNCGACSAKCSIMGATAKCEGGTCAVASCDGLKGDCDGNPMNACETDLSSTTSNCGACGKTCPFVVNGLPACAAGKCTAACDTGFGDCDSDLSNGCETNLLNNRMNCGVCGRTCPSTLVNGTPVCSSGTCSAICSAGYANCDSDLSNGCETNIATSPTNCGGCGVVCSALPNASATCGTGACVISSCSTNFGNCDGVVTNGCETNLLSSASNCGACGAACTLPNAVNACTSGTCSISSCNTGFANCNGITGDGCEVNTQTDANNCGGCGNVCPSGQSCVSGVCSLVVGVTYSQSLTTGTIAQTASQCTAWNTFRASISSTTTYSKVTLKGSSDPTGVSCTGSVANTLCQNLKNGVIMGTAVSCGGRSWKTGNCSANTTTQIELSANGDTCACSTGYIARPCIGNNNWGGINGVTCAAATQTITVTCE